MLVRDGLSDTWGCMHHLPCQELVRTVGFYAAAALAWMLAGAVAAIGGAGVGHVGLRWGERARWRKGPWRLRRELLALPGRIVRHEREFKVSLLGLGESSRKLFECYWGQLCRC